MLARRYCRIGAEVARFCAEAIDRPVVDAPNYTMREILWLIRNRAACHLEDPVLRRTQWALAAHLSAATLQDLAAVLAAELGKATGWQAAELARVMTDSRILACDNRIGVARMADLVLANDPGGTDHRRTAGKSGAVQEGDLLAEPLHA